MTEKVRILLMAASPEDRAELALDAELDRIESAVRSGNLRDRFEVRVSQETRADELISLMLEATPTVVHFSGHATATDGLLFEDAAGATQPLSAEFLGRLFAELPSVRCVVMNACWSAENGAAVAEHVDFVVGMASQVSDAAATAFSTVFYQAVAGGASLASAFELGVLQVQVESPTEVDAPVKLGADAEAATSLASAPELRGDIARQLYESEYLNLAKSISALLDDATCGAVVEEVFGEFVVVAPPVEAGKELTWIQDRVLTVASDRTAQGGAAPAHDPERVLAAIRSLESTAAQLLLHRYYRNMTDPEIAEALSVDVATVAPAINEAMAKVQAYLATVP